MGWGAEGGEGGEVVGGGGGVAPAHLLLQGGVLHRLPRAPATAAWAGLGGSLWRRVPRQLLRGGHELGLGFLLPAGLPGRHSAGRAVLLPWLLSWTPGGRKFWIALSGLSSVLASCKGWAWVLHPAGGWVALVECKQRFAQATRSEPMGAQVPRACARCMAAWSLGFGLLVGIGGRAGSARFGCKKLRNHPLALARHAWRLRWNPDDLGPHSNRQTGPPAGRAQPDRTRALKRSCVKPRRCPNEKRICTWNRDSRAFAWRGVTGARAACTPHDRHLARSPQRLTTSAAAPQTPGRCACHSHLGAGCTACCGAPWASYPPP